MKPTPLNDAHRDIAFTTLSGMNFTNNVENPEEMNVWIKQYKMSERAYLVFRNNGLIHFSQDSFL